MPETVIPSWPQGCAHGGEQTIISFESSEKVRRHACGSYAREASNCCIEKYVGRKAKSDCKLRSRRSNIRVHPPHLKWCVCASAPLIVEVCQQQWSARRIQGLVGAQIVYFQREWGRRGSEASDKFTCSKSRGPQQCARCAEEGGLVWESCSNKAHNGQQWNEGNRWTVGRFADGLSRTHFNRSSHNRARESKHHRCPVSTIRTDKNQHS